MSAFIYDFELLKQTREKKKISALNMAVELCLAERQILSLEQNSPQYFPSSSLRYSVLKKIYPCFRSKVRGCDF